LKTAEEYSQFELDLQWRFTEVADSSAISLGTNPRLTIRIDGGVPFAPGYPETIANRRTGEITSEKGAEPICRAVDTAKALVFPGDWNRLTVRQAGDRTTLGINGVQVAEVQAATSAEPAPIVLHSPQSEIAFREIWIKRLGD
jgi:hypothetical protein